jgi:hypothetical protein
VLDFKELWDAELDRWRARAHDHAKEDDLEEGAMRVMAHHFMMEAAHRGWNPADVVGAAAASACDIALDQGHLSKVDFAAVEAAQAAHKTQG